MLNLLVSRAGLGLGIRLGLSLGLGLGLGLGLDLVSEDIVVREQKDHLELSVQRTAKGFHRGREEGAAVRWLGLVAAAQDDNVPHCALRGPHGAFSLLVARVGDLTDLDERAERALGRPRASLEEAERFPEGIADQFFSAFSDFSAATFSERGLQGLDGAPRRLGRARLIVLALPGFELLETALASIEVGLPLLQALRPLLALVLQAPLAGSREARQEAIEHGGLGLDSGTWDASDAPEAARERCGCQLAGA